ncbi:HlyD family secretion protein [Caballeronia sp. GAFFF2]|uniref:HlyD family secretion protein n=1 Tax=Caballeronia sp. GAFFF2 TaxID=2921741 RepID=UPI002027937B|nr:HlyD family secretion protein [Caballeronia sp. GAFFF2]
MPEYQDTAARLSVPDPNDAAASAVSAQRRDGRRKNRLIIGAVVVAALMVAARMAWRSHYFEETDNAFLDGNITFVSPRIAGTVSRVLIKENQRVSAGDLMIQLDKSDQEIKVREVQAQFVEIDAQSKQVEAQIRKSTAEVQSARAEVERAEAQARRARTDAARYKTVFTEEMRAVSRQELDNAVAAADVAAAELLEKKERQSAAQAGMASAVASRDILLAKKSGLLVQLQDAQLQLSYNDIHAPVSGVVGRKNVEVGSRIALGQQVLAIVQDHVWVNANFKETQLGQLVPGQTATVHVDAFPAHDFVGHIESFSPASGNQFALLPPDNATGNFTKIVQRVPVRIALEPASVDAYKSRLAPGMSAVVEIDLRQGRPAHPAAAASHQGRS